MTACEGVGTGISIAPSVSILHPKYIYIAYSLIQNLKVNSALCYITYMVYKKLGNERQKNV